MENNKTATQEKPIQTPAKPSRMRAAVIVAPGRVDIEDVPIPNPADDEVRIKIEGCGICGSDLPVWQGREWFDYPRKAGSPGHEGFGVIDTIGKNVEGFKEGDRVAMLSYNAYAEYDIAKALHTVKLPLTLSGYPFPGEPLGCAINIFNRSGITSDDTVAVIGAGFIGNLLIQLSKSAGATVIAISQRETSLNMAFESGATHIIRMEDHYEIIRKINEFTDNNGCTRVIEATGKQWPLDLASDIVAERGKIIVAGFHQDGARQVNMQNWNWKGIDVINAHERDPMQYVKGMKEAVFAIHNGVLNPYFLFTHWFKLNELGQAFEKMTSREEGVLKCIIEMG